MDNNCYVCKNVINDENCDFECSDCDFVLCSNCYTKTGKDLCVEHPYNQECIMCYNKRVMLYNTKQIEKIKTILETGEKINKTQMLEIINKICFE
jgi:hypothetical protein